MHVLSLSTGSPLVGPALLAYLPSPAQLRSVLPLPPRVLTRGWPLLGPTYLETAVSDVRSPAHIPTVTRQLINDQITWAGTTLTTYFQETAPRPRHC